MTPQPPSKPSPRIQLEHIISEYGQMPSVAAREVLDEFALVRVDDDTIHAMAVVMAQHHRLDPMTSKDRCTCGYVTPLGHLFSSHVARAVLAVLTGSAA